MTPSTRSRLHRLAVAALPCAAMLIAGCRSTDSYTADGSNSVTKIEIADRDAAPATPVTREDRILIALERGKVFYRHGQLVRAREQFEEVLTLYPSHPEATKWIELLNDKLRREAERRREAMIRDHVSEIEWKWVHPMDGSIPDLTQVEVSNREGYDHQAENGFREVAQAPLSTFGIDVDTASYSNVRRMLQAGRLPPAGAVRVEEMLNYFTYNYPTPTNGHPFAAHVTVATCPWQPQHQLARVAIKGQEVDKRDRPAANLVFLVDVSGSMTDAAKLPLVIHGLTRLTQNLRDDDRVAIVVYAGASGLVLDSTRGADRQRIVEALDRLRAGGSTNGAAGIQLAYDTARRHHIHGGINRVILCTDGDFNVGVTNRSDLVDLISREAKTGVFLSVLGFGMDNLQDGTLEQLADQGNGHYGYVDSEAEAKKLLSDELTGTLLTIAKDVKIQVEFNPAKVSAYRLIGYENRVLAKEDFNDDSKDAGEIGAGHTVTALYEIVPVGVQMPRSASVDPLRYQASTNGTPPAELAGAPAAPPGAAEVANELMFVKLRYKRPDSDTSTRLTVAVPLGVTPFDRTDADFRFAVAVAAFGQKLRGSDHLGGMRLSAIGEIARGATANDPHGYRTEFLSLLDHATAISEKTAALR